MENLLNHLRERLRKMAPGGRPVDGMAFTGCLALAGRMAALGDDSALRSWPELFEALRRTDDSLLLEEILVFRIQCELWLLNENRGGELALSLIEASDFSLFFRRESEKLTDETRVWFRTWFAEAERVTLDAEAADILRGWLKTWPIPEEERLLPLVAPMSEEEVEILARYTEPASDIFVDASGAENGTLTAATPWGVVRMECRREGGRFTVGLRDDAGHPFPFQRAYLGPLPARRDEDQPERWTVDLSVVEEPMRARLLNQGLTAIHPFGGRVTFGSLSGRRRAHDLRILRRRVIPTLLRENWASAAAAGQEPIPDSCRWISPDEKFAAWGIYRKKITGGEFFEIHFLCNTEADEVPIGKEWDGRGVRLFGVGGTAKDGCVAFDLSAVRSQIRTQRMTAGEEPAGLEVAVPETDNWEVWLPFGEEK